MIKARKYFYIYLSALGLTLAVFFLWIFLLLKTSGSETGDIILLALFFTVLMGGELFFLILYLSKPKTLLTYEGECIQVNISKAKTRFINFNELTSIGVAGKSVLLMHKDRTVTYIRFLAKPQEARDTLQMALNQYINNNPDKYFADIGNLHC